MRTSPPLGLAYIAAVSEQAGHQVRVLDMAVEDRPLEAVLAEFQPDIVGITANTSQITAAWAAAETVQSIRGCPVVLGGAHPTVMPTESAEKPFVDAVVRGEGEETWSELLGRWQHLGRTDSSGEERQSATRARRSSLVEVLPGIAGLTFRTIDGQILHNPDRPLLRDLDSLPLPAYHLFRLESYTALQPTLDAPSANARSLAIMTSRGCPYRCIYCSQSIFPEKWRARSPGSVIAEWRHLVEDLGATEIGVLDDSFNIDRRRVIAICDLLIAEKLNRVPWLLINGIRANLVDAELLARMKAAGCKRVAFGVESGDQRILDSIHKKLTLAEVRAAFKAAKQAGLETIGFFMIGLPGETAETMERTIRFAIELDPVVANFSMATPFPGTELHRYVTEHGRLLMQGWDDYVFFEGKARYAMDGLAPELAEAKWHEAYRRFYLRPSRILRTLTRKSTWLNLPRTAGMATRLVLKRG